ncbi:hypothetical protein CPB84DRAFT_1516020 [Gymnopilus junonius]|uniref:RING-type E3 ubiquitin transferase n=1 Tax=Gymnopilus junonius TaxID=109634 RepID=A0A9P5NWT2_GYMJU|nr:hypothetical protein CPB84DRAFT_1516020 [Gymnopilus junonius]
MNLVFGQKSSRRPPCKYFLQGKCVYGDKCSNAHDTPRSTSRNSKAKKKKESSSESDNHAAAEPEPQNDDRWNSQGPGWEPFGDSANSSKEQTENDKSPCLFGSDCKNIDDCDFSHPDPSTSTKKSANDEAAGGHKATVPEYLPTQRDAKSDKNPGQSAYTLKASDQQASAPPSVAPAQKRGQSIPSDRDYNSHAQDLEDDHEDMEYERQDNTSGRDDSGWGGQQEESDVEGLWGDDADDEPAQRTSRVEQKSKSPRDYDEGVGGTRDSSASPSPHTRRLKRPEQSSSPSETKYPHISQVQIHWSQFADPHADAEIPFCKLHAQGQCMRGEECKFRHSVTVEEYTLLFRDQQPNLWTLKRDTKAAAQPARPARRPIPEKPASIDEQIQSPAVQEPPPTRSAIPPTARECTFYPLGKCRNGDMCPYRHVNPPERPHEVAPDTAHLQSDQDNWGSGGNSGVVKSRKPCVYFTTRGYCQRGDSCHFLHGDANPDRNYPSSGVSGPASSGNENANNGDDDGWGASWDPIGEDTQPAVVVNWEDTVDNSGWNHVTEPAVQPVEHSEPATEDSKAPVWGKWPPEEDSSSHAPWAVPSVPCPYFAKGNCRKGNACNMLHDTPKRGSRPSHPENRSSSSVAPKDPEHANVADEIDKSWSQPWPTEGESSLSKPTKINAPCKDYGEGHCKYGDGCRYLHIIVPEPSGQQEGKGEGEGVETEEGGEEEDEQEQLPPSEQIPSVASDDSVDSEEVEEPSSGIPAVSEIEEAPSQRVDSAPEPALAPIVFNHPHVQKLMMNCEVTFGSDITPSHIKPLPDTTDLLLSGLPLQVSPEDIRTLADPYGKIEEISSVDDTGTQTILVKFAEMVQAVNAFKHLNSRTFQSTVIAASLRSQVHYSLSSPGQNLVLKVTWPKPRVYAWSHYQTVSKAKTEANKLNNAMFRGRKIKAEFITPLRNQRNPYSVIKLDLLPLDVTKADIEDLCKDPALITVNRPTYTDDPVDLIRSSLATFGGLQSFDILPENDMLSTCTAFATFKTEQMAEAARDSLDNCKQEFLGQESLIVRSAHFSRYRITLEQFEAVKNELDALTEKCAKKCTIQCNDHRLNKNVKYVYIFALLEHEQTFTDLNAELWQLLHGAVLKESDGSDVWDDYFDVSSSAKALKQYSTDTNTLIFCDHRMKQLRLFGSKNDQEQAHKMIRKLLSKVHSQRHELELPRPKLHHLINGTLTTLQVDIGINKVSLDAVNSKLIVRGSADDVSKAELAIEALSPEIENLGIYEACQICEHAPIKPITLSCHHKYCHNCLEFAIRQTGHGPFRCVSNQQGRQCPAYVPYVILSDILPAKEEENVLRSSFVAHVLSRSDEFFFCPSSNCKAVYRSGEEGINLMCKLCLAEICTYCRCFAHPRLDCPERSVLYSS